LSNFFIVIDDENGFIHESWPIEADFFRGGWLLAVNQQ
jgi:hypothetical protein